MLLEKRQKKKPAPLPPRKVLVLHGWGQSGAEMAKLLGCRNPQKLKKSSLARKLKTTFNIDLVCADAPHALPATATINIDGVDVVVDDGISELEVRRSEYRLLLENKGIDGLIRALNAKADQLMSQ